MGIIYNFEHETPHTMFAPHYVRPTLCSPHTMFAPHYVRISTDDPINHCNIFANGFVPRSNLLDVKFILAGTKHFQSSTRQKFDAEFRFSPIVFQISDRFEHTKETKHSITTLFITLTYDIQGHRQSWHQFWRQHFIPWIS